MSEKTEEANGLCTIEVAYRRQSGTLRHENGGGVEGRGRSGELEEGSRERELVSERVERGDGITVYLRGCR